MKCVVKCGIDRLNQTNILKEKRIGLITNPTGLNRALKSTIDILNEEYQLVCMMSPEHGVRGNLQAGDHVETYTDSKTSLPVYSLYGDSCHIKADVMDKIDVFVFDIQDVGARFYTYLYTLAYAMEDSAKAGKPVIVLDRPNPISCGKAEGTVLDKTFTSFVGRFPIATRYGMTIGEYANFINKEYNIECDLHIVKMEGYSRSIYYDETDLFWIPPSPNLPTIDSCICYIGTCLFEGTNVSEGRGTTKPFEIVGAPWLNAQKVMDELTKRNLKGVCFRETYFTPTFSKHQGELCNGIQLHVTDRTIFNAFETGVWLVDIIRKLHKEFEFLPPMKQGGRPFIDLLLGTDAIRSENFNASAFFVEQRKKVAEYQQIIKQYALYDE